MVLTTRAEVCKSSFKTASIQSLMRQLMQHQLLLTGPGETRHMGRLWPREHREDFQSHTTFSTCFSQAFPTAILRCPEHSRASRGTAWSWWDGLPLLGTRKTRDKENCKKGLQLASLCLHGGQQRDEKLQGQGAVGIRMRPLLLSPGPAAACSHVTACAHSSAGCFFFFMYKIWSAKNVCQSCSVFVCLSWHTCSQQFWLCLPLQVVRCNGNASEQWHNWCRGPHVHTSWRVLCVYLEPSSSPVSSECHEMSGREAALCQHVQARCGRRAPKAPCGSKQQHWCGSSKVLKMDVQNGGPGEGLCKHWTIRTM